MAELIELLTNWAHWSFEIISGSVFFAAGLVVPERFNPVKRLVSRHDREKHSRPVAPMSWDDPEFRDQVARFVIQEWTPAEGWKR
jgi:hypothetical protein